MQRPPHKLPNRRIPNTTIPLSLGIPRLNRRRRPFQYNPVLPRLPPPRLLLTCSFRRHPLAMRHWHFLLCEYRIFGPRALYP